MATPLSSAPPPFVPVQLDPTKDSDKDTEGTSAIPEKTSEAGQAEKKAEEIAAKKSKARQRDSESKGKWWPCTTTETELKNLEGEGFLLPGSWRTIPNALAPAPQDNEMLEALEESELGTLVRVPTTGNTDPEAASEAEAHDAPRPSKRKRPAPSSPAAKRACEVLSTAATRKAEAEKKRLKLIDTSNKGQPDIQQFFKPSGSGSQPPKAPRILKKKVKPSPALVPVTPEVEVPPKASSASKPDPKDVINLDDLPDDPIGHGDSGKGASSSAPPPDQPSATFAGPTKEEYEQKVQLIHTSSTLQANPQPASSLQKRSLAERHAEVSAMLDKVWGKSNMEMQELTELEDEETAKHSAFDDLSAKVKVLEAENESLKAFIKESSGKEIEARKELSKKHARDMTELNDKLKKSQSRVTSLVAKNKVQEAEVEAIDKLIFRDRRSSEEESLRGRSRDIGDP
nr:uncharacterized protein LOC127340229 [Lolium perenne]